ncbi:FAD/NAD(P)-binding domain-containing protein [Cryphonectria parasitica EP155]|uniref:FAD/NAD(P)-binding domain-containing protein n=1 Tax=Cryphonectria parasitica (strain ATCC 38755 / EP155) TaxID=660469 RepID=A0A9P4XX09_CRYP1|nr:FAD/NAD(P)-binding domain-containing protein [Cryphonectria parasitica EP155]KAF3762120.1 FAD/NAD(P)-binding domain-containing protein [Cryphonectria parasitica EP155]
MSSIRIAVSGGGLAGATLLHGRLNYPQLDVHIFESAESFNEAGAAIGVARNALTALDLIGSSAPKCLERAGAMPMNGVRFMLGQGEATHGKRVVSIVHRAAFLRELLAEISPERLHSSKKLKTIEKKGSEESILLHFTDGTTHECDVLVGADSIHSTVRKFILGENDPAASPRNTGTWTIMALKPAAQAKPSFGDGPIDEAREYSWLGDGEFLMHNMFNQGQMIQLIVAAHEAGAEDSDRWQRTVSVDELKDLYKGFPGHLKKVVDELLCDQPEQPAIYLWEHPPARTYLSGPVCIMGDAAHATSPWQGSGGGMTIEDALILATVLGRATSQREACAALEIYDEVRRPRTQRIVESSRRTGLILAGRDEAIGLDLDRLRGNVLSRWDFIVDFDIEKHRDNAVDKSNKKLEQIASSG